MRFILSFVAGVLLAALGLEAVLRVLPVQSGVRQADSTAAAPYPHYRPAQPFVYSYGWAMANVQRGTTSRDGFNNSKDIADGANAIVTGDSFIESFMLPYADTVQGRLDAAVGKVYAAASSGNGLADALTIARHFLPRTHAKTMVVFVEPYDLRLIESRGGRGHNYFSFGEQGIAVASTPYVESHLKETVLHSALLRYAYYNLKLPDWAGTKGGKPAEVDASDRAALALRHARRDAALDYFVAETAKLQRQYGTRFVFLVDGDRNAIYSNGKTPPAWAEGDREALLTRLRTASFDVVDMQPVFAQHWATYRERMDFLPMDGHWNRVAHRLAAEQVLPLVRR